MQGDRKRTCEPEAEAGRVNQPRANRRRCGCSGYGYVSSMYHTEDNRSSSAWSQGGRLRCDHPKRSPVSRVADAPGRGAVLREFPSVDPENGGETASVYMPKCSITKQPKEPIIR